MAEKINKKPGGGLRWLRLLMGITILGVAGFQAYWLKQNYEREKRSLAIKADVAFHETVQRLQVSKLKLDGFPGDSSIHGDVKIFMSESGDEKNMNIHVMPKQKIISTINVISSKLKDSLKRDTTVKGGMIISMDKSSMTFHNDTVKRVIAGSPGKDQIFQVLYGVDSLQDTLKLAEINSAYTVTLKKQKLDIPFAVQRLDSSAATYEHVFNEVTVGFARPITYRLSLGNTFSYLLKRISLPILFSFILLGITILSFVLLYRSLLRQRRLAELKNEFISNITHELKTPIATVGVAIEALRNFNAINDPQRTKEYLDISSNELQRLGLLVDKVLKLSMFEKKEIDLKYESMNLGEIISEVIASMKLQLEKQHAKVSVQAEGDLNLQGDRLHLTSVVFNLLDNALKYSKEDPAIQIELKEDENNVMAIITDNGIGISPEYKEKIFDKFFRVPHGDTHNAKGYGLGLSYVAQVIRKHNGTIDVESQKDIGTKFTITLPKQTA